MFICSSGTSNIEPDGDDFDQGNLDLGNSRPDPALQKVKALAEKALVRAHELGIVK